MSSLLVGVGELEELAFVPRSPEQFYPDRKAIGGEAARDGDRRQPRVGAEVAVNSREVLSLVEQGRLLAGGRVGEGI